MTFNQTQQGTEGMRHYLASGRRYYPIYHLWSIPELWVSTLLLPLSVFWWPRFNLPSAHDLSLKYWFWICQTHNPFVGRNAGNISNNTSIVNKTHCAPLYSRASALSSKRDRFTSINEPVL